MNIHFKTLGCRLNEAETESWAQQFHANGHNIVQGSDNADLIVLNSCAVTSEASRKSRRLIRRIQRENPKVKMVVSGCYASLNQQEVAEALGVDLVINNSDKKQLVKLASRQLGLPTTPIVKSESGKGALFSRGRQRAFVKVQDGCRYRCTYCIVTIARGEESSRSISEIVDEINNLEREDIKEVILTGVHLGGYGSDLGTNLEHLIESVLTHTSIPRIRLGSLEPWDLHARFFKLFRNPRLMPHLHLPLQSGSGSVLKRMARRCDTTEFKKIVQQLNAITPEFNITTDIIVGFPGETEQEWMETLKYVESIGFGDIHIFAYSPRAGTKAADYPSQNPKLVKKQRSKQLHKLAELMKLNAFNRCLGRNLPVLWESQSNLVESKSALVFGYTPNYLRVATVMDKPEKLENQIRPARLKAVACSGDYILAEL